MYRNKLTLTNIGPYCTGYIYMCVCVWIMFSIINVNLHQNLTLFTYICKCWQPISAFEPPTFWTIETTYLFQHYLALRVCVKLIHITLTATNSWRKRCWSFQACSWSCAKLVTSKSTRRSVITFYSRGLRLT